VSQVARDRVKISFRSDEIVALVQGLNDRRGDAAIDSLHEKLTKAQTVLSSRADADRLEREISGG
jgi:hypothetical protein